MSNSATSAAKRRRAGPLLSSPLFQAPQSFQAPPVANVANDTNATFQFNKTTNQSSPSPVQSSSPSPYQNSTDDLQSDNKFLTVQQVINLISTRLVKLEGMVNRPQEVPSATVPDVHYAPVVPELDESKIVNLCKMVLSEHLEEFDHRYSMLAEELVNLKNLITNLQSYTMEVNAKLVQIVIPDISSSVDSPVATPEVAPVVTPEVALVVTPEVAPVVTPEVAPVVTPEVAPVVTPEVEPVVTPEVGPVSTPEVEPVVTPEVAPVVTPEVKPVVTQEVEPVATSEVEPVVTPEVEPVATQEVEPVATPEVKPVVTPEVKPAVSPSKKGGVTPSRKGGYKSSKKANSPPLPVEAENETEATDNVDVPNINFDLESDE